MADVYTHFLKPLLQIFKPNDEVNNRKAWISAYKAALQHFSEETLINAASKLISERQVPFFPLPAECIAVCREEAAIIADARQGKRETKQAARDNEGIRMTALADDLFARHPEAARSLREEWWWRLWSWMQKHGRSPDIHELKNIEAKGKSDYVKYLGDIKGNMFAPKLKAWRNIAYKRISGLLGDDNATGRHQTMDSGR